MPSRFPGIDPYLEGQEWEDFHHHFIEECHARLVSQLRPKYVVRVERRVYVEHEPEEVRTIRPDIAVLQSDDSQREAAEWGGAAVAIEPIVLTLPLPETHREAYLTVRERDSLEVVTVIEVLSPTNKRRHSDGRFEYLNKREEVLRSTAHLVELDLLRGGERLPTIEALPPADYFAFVSRASHRPKVSVYRWRLRQPLPPVPIPLADPDPAAVLNLQDIFAAVYDRAGYDYSLDYTRPIEPPLPETDQEWVRKWEIGDPN